MATITYNVQHHTKQELIELMENTDDIIVRQSGIITEFRKTFSGQWLVFVNKEPLHFVCTGMYKEAALTYLQQALEKGIIVIEEDEFHGETKKESNEIEYEEIENKEIESNELIETSVLSNGDATAIVKLFSQYAILVVQDVNEETIITQELEIYEYEGRIEKLLDMGYRWSLGGDFVDDDRILRSEGWFRGGKRLWIEIYQTYFFLSNISEYEDVIEPHKMDISKLQETRKRLEQKGYTFKYRRNH